MPNVKATDDPASVLQLAQLPSGTLDCRGLITCAHGLLVLPEAVPPLLIYPLIDLLRQHVERQRARIDHLIVELANVELATQFLLRSGAGFLARCRRVRARSGY